ncbi:hypothetical protein TRFO_02782 [Tritrichomonas foetus]|uniref:Uncharacterized protein n=1 Tax=Tritrichomonas foetus TaxID=1144522 RepID=A0A1J4KW77_9EUKA|nr:hypothetical protein TRFO_02782 [Tritrichomonas foetus]|eukprot:OHT15479.1 hypothetical protein TRFO_02782 [Tritrichomonas foetus]
MTELHLSFKDWAYPTKKNRITRCAWGECGFLAISVGEVVTIYSNEIGQFSPMFMWSPFEHDVVAMGWYDGSCTPSVVQPILAIASSKGTVAVYDVRNRNVIGKVRVKNEIINCIVWNPFYRSRFYIGTQNGRFIACQVEDHGKDVAIRLDMNLGYSIDFISIDPQTGTTIAVASKCGKFSVINNVLKAKNDDVVDVFTLAENNPEITSLLFFPGHSTFLIVATSTKSVLFSIQQQITIPLILTEDIRFISYLTKSNDKIIIGHSSSVSLWQFDFAKSIWNRKSIINFSKISAKFPEARMFAELDNKIVIVTQSHWITVIEERRDKIFIVQRIRLMPAKPLDWDFRKGSIAFCTSDGQVLVTSWTPNCIIQPTGRSDVKSSDNLCRDSSLTSSFNNKMNNNGDIDSSRPHQVQFSQNLFNGFDVQNNVNIALNPLENNLNNQFNHDFKSNANKNEAKPTFTMLMDQADDEIEFDVNNDDFENSSGLDFSTSFVSVQASHVRRPVISTDNQVLSSPLFENNDTNNEFDQELNNGFDNGMYSGFDRNRNDQKTMENKGHQRHLLNNINRKTSNTHRKTFQHRFSDYSDSGFRQVEDDKSSLSLKLPMEVSLEKQNSSFHNDDNNSILSTNYSGNLINHSQYESHNNANGNANNVNETSECGNSCKLLLCFKVADYPLNHVMWAPGGRLIVWSFYNEKNILQLVDFKRRRVIPLLKVQLNAIHVPITRIFFSKDRSMFCVLIGDQTAVFMSTSAQPKQIGTLNFRHPVIGSFDPTGRKAVFIRKDGLLYFASITSESIVVTQKFKSKYLHDKMKGEPTYIIWRSIGILIGTSLGFVILLNGDNYSNFQPIAKLKSNNTNSSNLNVNTPATVTTASQSNAITFISPCSDKIFLITDNKKNAYISSNGEVKVLKRSVKNIKAASHESFLYRVSGSGKLSVISSNGPYVPLSPPCVSRCPLMIEEEKYHSQLTKIFLNSPIEAVKACRLFGSVFIRRLIQSRMNHYTLNEQVKLLFGILSSCEDFSEVAIRMALKIGDNETAKQLLLNTSPTDPHYLRNMNRAALFDLKAVGESVIGVVQNLFANGKTEEATEILLTVGGIDFLVKKYLDMGQIREAAMILRIRRDSKDYSKLAYEVASNLIDNRCLLLGLLILTEFGYHEEVTNIVSRIYGDEMTHLLSFLNE